MRDRRIAGGADHGHRRKHPAWPVERLHLPRHSRNPCPRRGHPPECPHRPAPPFPDLGKGRPSPSTASPPPPSAPCKKRQARQRRSAPPPPPPSPPGFPNPATTAAAIPDGQRLSPHLLALAAERPLPATKAMSLASQSGGHFSSKPTLRSPRPSRSQKKCTVLAEALHGPEHRETGSAWTNLGNCQYVRKRPQSRRNLLRPRACYLRRQAGDGSRARHLSFQPRHGAPGSGPARRGAGEVFSGPRD